jgi:DDE superfamily endonuclease
VTDKIVRVLVNVTYSYAIIVSAATDVQGKEKWENDEKINNLKFSNKWVKAFLKRGGLSRRKITREDKAIPDDDVVAVTLKIGQDLYVLKRHDPSSCWNFDETAFTWAIGPSYMYCPGNQQRATNIGISNDKVRITAVIAVNALGEFAPLMLIVKHSASSEIKPDQTGMLVIPNLHKKPGFRVEDGWELRLWEKTLTINGVTAHHKVRYLIHLDTGHVITSQCKAWNDTIRMVLWFEIVMLPLKNKHQQQKMLLWCDNCGSHKTACVRDVIRETNIDVAFLPPNMTSELQVLDLVVNGPLKAHIRTIRANRLYAAFQEYKLARNADQKLPPSERLNLDFNPPKPTMIEGIKDLLLLFKEQFTEAKFRECINRTFTKTGTLPITDSSPATFVEYKKELLFGTMLVVPDGTIDEKLDEHDLLPDLPVVDEEENVERALFLYFVNNNNVLNTEPHDDDDTDDLVDSESD